MKYYRPSWTKIYSLCEELAAKVSRDYAPDIVIAIARGAFIPARVLCDILEVKNLGSVQASYYTGVGQTAKEPVIVYPTTADVRGQRILLVDDVVDSGITLEFIKKYLEGMKPTEVRTACLHYKPRSKVVPDYFVEVTDAWIVYPWGKHELYEERKKQKTLATTLKDFQKKSANLKKA